MILFTSDNGPEEWMRYPACNLQHGSVAPLRGHKLDVFEGGIRVPLIISWPAVIKQGRVSRQAVSSLDILPTFNSLANATVPKGLVLDGCDISGHIIKDEKIARTKPLFWFYYAVVAMRTTPCATVTSSYLREDLAICSIQEGRSATRLDFRLS